MKIKVYSAITANHDPVRVDGIMTLIDWSHFNNPLAAARFYKACPHLLFPKTDWTIWVDGNVELNVEPEKLVEMVGTQGFGAFSHFHRETPEQEAVAIIKGGFDTPPNVSRALALTNEARSGLAQTMVLVRKNTSTNASRNERWWSLMCASSFRDQLTFPTCFPGPYWPTVDFTQPNRYFTRTA